MEFKLEVGGYETIFSQYEIYTNINKKELTINFINLEQKNFTSFCSKNNKSIFLDEESHIISFICEEEKLQFAIYTTNFKENYFHYFFTQNWEIGFSAKDKLGNQFDKVNIFSHK